MSTWPRPLAGQTALVTGGARRIGREIAISLAGAGANVAITYRNSSREAEDTCAAMLRSGVRALAVPCDVRDEASVVNAVVTVLGEFGGIDLLINNAGAFESRTLEAISVDEWDEMFAINTRGPFLVARSAFSTLKSRRGRIVNIGSLGGLEPWATHGHYCASKAALHMLSKTMAKSWAPEISVNCIAPGMIQQGEVEEAYRRFAERTPMKRNGTALDVAAATLFFASGPHFVTGQVLAVDGGLSL